MALKIRFRQQGSANRRTYRLVLADGRERRDGKYIEKFGWYDPSKEVNNCLLDETKIKYWIDRGAQLTPDAKALVARALPKLMLEIRLKEQARLVKKAKKRRARRKQPVPAA